MKKILLTIPAAALLTYCTSSKKSSGTISTANGGTASQRFNLPDRSDVAGSPSDTVFISGTQYIPLEGRSETGTRAELEGSWVLDSLNGASIPGRSNINVEVPPKTGDGSEWKRDSVTTTEKVNGVTETVTMVNMERMTTPGNKITPPQRESYHIPAKPSINFFGANETFSGFTGCNRYSGRYAVGGKDTISLKGAAASTKMVCLGDYDETAFLNTLRRVNSFKAVNGRLQLSEGDKVLLVFSKKRE